MYITKFEWEGQTYQNVPVEGLTELGIPEEMQKSLIQQMQIEQAKAAIAQRIYRDYSAQQQAQDEKWTTSYLMQLKAAGVPQTEAGLMAIFIGTNPVETATIDWMETWPDEVINKLRGIDEAARQAKAVQMIIKLTKIARRTAWAEACVTEGVQAIQEERTPDYPNYQEYTHAE